MLESAHIYNIEEGEMNRVRGFRNSRTIAAFVVSLSVLCAIFWGARLLRAQSAAAGAAQSDNALLADFRRVEVASVSDALEQLTGKRMYMSHRMHPIFTTADYMAAGAFSLGVGGGSGERRRFALWESVDDYASGSRAGARSPFGARVGFGKKVARCTRGLDLFPIARGM
jgi:hypothetical protein